MECITPKWTGHAGSCARGTRRLPTATLLVDSKAPLSNQQPAAKAHSRCPPLPLRQAACALGWLATYLGLAPTRTCTRRAGRRSAWPWHWLSTTGTSLHVLDLASLPSPGTEISPALVRSFTMVEARLVGRSQLPSPRIRHPSLASTTTPSATIRPPWICCRSIQRVESHRPMAP